MVSESCDVVAAVPIRLPHVMAAQLDPVIFQFYKATACFATPSVCGMCAPMTHAFSFYTQISVILAQMHKTFTHSKVLLIVCMYSDMMPFIAKIELKCIMVAIKETIGNVQTANVRDGYCLGSFENANL